MADIIAIDPCEERARNLADILDQSVEMAKEALESNIAGFALVTWDMRGSTHTAYLAETGPVSAAFVPFFAMQALQTHRAVVVSHETASVSVTPRDE